MLKLSRPKTENFQIKILIFFTILLQTHYGYSLEPSRLSDDTQSALNLRWALMAEDTISDDAVNILYKTHFMLVNCTDREQIYMYAQPGLKFRFLKCSKLPHDLSLGHPMYITAFLSETMLSAYNIVWYCKIYYNTISIGADRPEQTILTRIRRKRARNRAYITVKFRHYDHT